MEIETKTIYIDSDNLENKVENDEVYIENQISVMSADVKNGEYIDVELVSFVARNDFYQMNDSNNTFSFTQNGTTTTYHLQNGFPSVLSIDNELKQDLEDATGQIWNVSYSNYTGKITLSSNYDTTPPADLAVNFDVLNSCFRMIGFDKANYPFVINGNNVSLTAPRVVNLGSRVKAVYIRTSLIQDQYEANAQGLDTRDILGTIPLEVSPLQNISFVNATDSFRHHIKGNNITSFNIRITNRENELIGLNSGFQLVLRFYKVKKPSETQEKILRDMFELQQIKWINKEESSKKNK